MKVIGFDGRERSINFSRYYVYDDDTRHKSNLHKKAKKVLREVFPYDTILLDSIKINLIFSSLKQEIKTKKSGAN
jgi:hypothetical protein